MQPENAIEIRNMSKSFRVLKDQPKSVKEWITRGSKKAARNEVLKDISLDIRKGETVVLIGTNGTGKSTLLKLMTRILYPNSGTIETQGKLASLLELGAGFHPDFTGRENIYFNAAVFGMSRKEIESRVDDIIEFSELGHFIDEPVRTYSSGMYMRLAFSVAINVDVDILLIDEILAVGDQHFQNKCFEKLEELRDSNTTVVIVSHSLDSVKDLCTRAVWIYKGHVQLDGNPAYVISQYLKQSAIDNREKQKEQARKSDHIQGILFVDGPRNFSSNPISQPLRIYGWSISQAQNAMLEILADDQPVEGIERMPREDVFDVYKEEYAGLMDPATIGWNTTIDPKEMGLKPGEHTLQITLKSEDQIIDRKKVKVSLEDVPVS